MKLRWIILGTVFQLHLAFFAFMMVVFSSAGIVNNTDLNGFQYGLLSSALYGIPLSCIAVLGSIIYCYNTKAPTYWYRLHLVPIGLMAMYFVYAVYLS